MMRKCWRSVLLMVAVSLFSPAIGAQTPQRLLDFGITGSEKGSYSAAMSRIAVEKLLLDIAEQPRDAAFVEAALNGTGVSPRDLEDLGLVRREGDAYRLNFFLLTKEDDAHVRDVTARHARQLTAALLARRAQLETALRQYDMPGVDPREVAFVLLGCFALDWDGLDVTAEMHYRSTASVRPNGEQYIPWAREKHGNGLKAMYWGSHNDQEGEVVFTSFGDHFTLPRTALPDLFWHLPPLPRDQVPEDVHAPLAAVVRQSHKATLRTIGKMMLALRDGPKTASDLASIAGTTAEEASSDLALLEQLDYVRHSGDTYRACVPVFAERDRAMIRTIRDIGSEAMKEWLSADYDRLQNDLGDLAPLRSGVSYKDSFTQIWHYVFAATNRQLVEAGLFADAYAPGRRYKGFVPVVWQHGLDDDAVR